MLFPSTFYLFSFSVSNERNNESDLIELFEMELLEEMRVDFSESEFANMMDSDIFDENYDAI